jgi:predicted phosphodiesterase
MRINILSDLHLDVWAMDEPCRLTHPAADLTIVPGDLCELKNHALGSAFLASIPNAVLYVPGNHDWYNYNHDDGVAAHAVYGKLENVTVLDPGYVVIDGIRFIGATWWSRLSWAVGAAGSAKSILKRNSQLVENHVNDFFRIKTCGRLMRAHDSVAWHKAERRFIVDQIQQAREAGQRIVVATHFGPTRGSIVPKYANHPLNPYFANDDVEATTGVGLWVHGHIHDPVDYVIGECRVVANPLGYPNERRIEHYDSLFTIDF